MIKEWYKKGKDIRLYFRLKGEFKEVKQWQARYKERHDHIIEKRAEYEEKYSKSYIDKEEERRRLSFNDSVDKYNDLIHKIRALQWFIKEDKFLIIDVLGKTAKNKESLIGGGT